MEYELVTDEAKRNILTGELRSLQEQHWNRTRAKALTEAYDPARRKALKHVPPGERDQVIKNFADQKKRDMFAHDQELEKMEEGIAAATAFLAALPEDKPEPSE